MLAPSYASARWVVRRPHLLEYEWNEAAGRRGFEEALKLCDQLAKHPSGRLSGMVSPAQIDTCTEDLLRDSVAAARERGLPFTVPLRPGGGRVLRDGAPPRHHAGPVGAPARPDRTRHDLRPRHLRRRALVAPLVVEEGHRDHGGDRDDDRAQPDALRALRPDARRTSASTGAPASTSAWAPIPCRRTCSRRCAGRRCSRGSRPRTSAPRRWPRSSTRAPWAAPGG